MHGIVSNTVRVARAPMFVPNYLKDQVLSDSVLSKYDHVDINNLTYIMLEALTGRTYRDRINPETRDKLIELYHKPGDFVFNDNMVTMDGKPVFEVVLNTSDSGCADIIIICHNGSTNMATLGNRDLAATVEIWLVEYLIRRVGESQVYNTELFEGYWLNTK